MFFAFATTLAHLALTTPPSCLGPTLTALQAAKTRADSLAVAKPEEAKAGQGDACAKLIVGYAVGMTSTPSEDAAEWQSRQHATEMLESLQRDYGDEPRLYLALAMLAYHRQVWTDAYRIFDRALEHKASGAAPLTPHEIAIIYYTRGLMHQDLWRDWRSYGHLLSTAGGQMHCSKYTDQTHSSFSSSSEDYSWVIGFNTVCPTQFDSVMTDYYQSDAKLKQQELDALEAQFDSAASIDTTLILPLVALASEYTYMGDWEKAGPVSDALRRRFPDDYRSWAIAGLVSHESRHDSLASLQFGQALIRMSDAQLADYDDITPLLEPSQVQWFDSADASTKARGVGAFWNSLDPLYITPYNERKLEHYARVTAANLMFGSLALGQEGAKSFAGQIWIRYGRPTHMRELAEPSARAVFWDYGGGDADITFERGITRASYRGTDDARDYSRRLAAVRPQGYRTDNFIDSVKAIEQQLVRFRGPDGRPQLLVYAMVPPGFSDQAKAATLLLDAQYQSVGEWRGARPANNVIKRLFSGMRYGLYSMTIEVWDAGPRHLGRARDTVWFRPDSSQLALSDLLLAASIDAGGATPAPNAGRDQLNIEPLYGSALTQNHPLALYWEIYGLKAESDGRARYSVSVQVEDAAKRPMLARLLGGGARDAQSKIVYDGSHLVSNGRVAEWLSLSSDLSPGPYKVIVTVTDKGTNATKTVERELTVR